MHEMVTMKKNGPGWIHVLVAGGLAAGSFIGYRAALTHFLTERHYGRLSGGSKVFWCILCYLIIVLFMEGILYFTKYLLTVLTNRERYAAVRKSSMENEMAGGIFQKYRKHCRLVNELDNLVTYLVIALIIMIYAMKENGNSSLLIFAVVIIVIIMPFNPIRLGQLKKARNEMNSCFISNCDAAMLYDVYEHSKLYYTNRREKEMGLLMQAEISYFMGDYPELASKLSQCGKYLPVSYQMIHLYYRGIYALDTGDRNTFYACFREMDAFVMKKSLPPQQKNLADIIRKEWTIRADLIDGDPISMIPIIDRMIPNEKNAPDRMNRIFQLAWLQLKVGDKEHAAQNLRTVAAGAGTMIIRQKAMEILNDQL